MDALVPFLNLYQVKQSQKRPLNACVMFLTVKKSPLPLELLLSGKVFTHFEPCNYSLNNVQGLQFTYLKQI